MKGHFGLSRTDMYVVKHLSSVGAGWMCSRAGRQPKSDEAVRNESQCRCGWKRKLHCKPACAKTEKSQAHLVFVRWHQESSECYAHKAPFFPFFPSSWVLFPCCYLLTVHQPVNFFHDFPRAGYEGSCHGTNCIRIDWLQSGLRVLAFQILMKTSCHSHFILWTFG